MQQAVYNGWLRKHGIKAESVHGPNGMCLHIWGPSSMRHNDLWCLNESGVNTKFAAVQEHLPPENQKSMYGDGIYPIRSHLTSRHHNPVNLQQESENKAMNSCRESIEHDYGQGHELFPFLNYNANLKLASGTPVAEIYFAKDLFRNLHVTLYSNVTGSRFKNVSTPTLEQYLA
jgi:hypothetical protein